MEIIDELKKAGFLDFSKKELTEVMFQSTEFMTINSKDYFIPLLNQVISPTKRDNAIIGTFYRIQAWMSSLSAMSKTAHYQGVASGARSLFELLLDILILKRDTTGTDVDKYHFFPKVEKFRVATKLINFVNIHTLSQVNLSIQKKYINNFKSDNSIVQKLQDLYGLTITDPLNKFPLHWTGKNLRERAKELGLKYEEIYIDTYPKLSWFIHSGGIGWDFEITQFIQIFGLCHDMIQKRFIEAMIETAKSLGIDKGITAFYEKMKKLSKVPALLMMERKFKENE